MTLMSRRQFGAACTLTALAGLVPRPSFASVPNMDDRLLLVDPELRPAALNRLSVPVGDLGQATLAARRESMSAFVAPPAASPTVARRSIAGADGDPDVIVYIINARPGARRPAVLHVHGGGYVFGSAQGSVAALQRIAAELDCVVVTVDYRLAPETSFAGSMRDTYAALRWLHTHADELGADPARIAVMGESAGGGHAALLALTARDRGEVPLIFQALIYPMLDDRTGSSRPTPVSTGALVWTAADNRFGWASFLGQAPGTTTVPEHAVPARYRDLAGLPPTFIGVGSIDLFVDEDVDYARRLIDAGVPTELVVLPGAYHAFDLLAADTGIATRFTATKLAALRRAFEQIAR